MKEKLLAGLAWTLFAVGISLADSDCLLIPLILTFAGAVLLLKVYH